MSKGKQKEKSKKAKPVKAEGSRSVEEILNEGKPAKEAKMKAEKVAKAPKEKKVKDPKPKKEKKVKEPKVKVVKELPPIDATRAAEVKQNIEELVANTEQEYLDLAELLYEAQVNGYWREWDFEDFAEYANSLAIGFRKAQYYVSIWAAVVRCGDALDRKKLIELGWSKVKELASVVQKETAEEWVDNSASMSAREVQEAVKIEKKKKAEGKVAKGEAPVVVTLSMRLEESTHAAIAEAISEAKMLLNTESDADALSHICLEWQESKGSVPTKTPLAKVLKWIEKAYSVKIKFSQVEAPPEEVNPQSEVDGLLDGKVGAEDDSFVPDTDSNDERSVKDILGL